MKSSQVYLFKPLVSRHNVNRTKIHTEESQARISHAIYTKCLLNKNVFKLRLNEATVNWLSIIAWGKLFHIFGAEKQKARLPNTVLGVEHWRSLCDADRNCLWGWWKWIKSARYSGWLVVRTLYVIKAILYWFLSLIGNRWRRASIGVMCSDLPEPTTARANEFWRRWSLSMLHWEVPWRILLQ